eukprot:2914016-Amphidinium_carterae.1
MRRGGRLKIPSDFLLVAERGTDSVVAVFVLIVRRSEVLLDHHSRSTPCCGGWRQESAQAHSV